MVAAPALPRFVFIVLLTLGGINSLRVEADALMKTEAVKASSIVQYFVDDQGVRVELEIGMASLKIFRNLLPDSLYRELGFGDAPLSGRLKTFFSHDLGLLVNDKPLPGFVSSIGPDRRVLRDPINGTPLPVQDGAPQVVRASLMYLFPKGTRPAQIELTTPAIGDIGFVVYHNDVAVNDFRYLGSGYRLTLDWDDPWYTHFNKSQSYPSILIPHEWFY